MRPPHCSIRKSAWVAAAFVAAAFVAAAVVVAAAIPATAVAASPAVSLSMPIAAALSPSLSCSVCLCISLSSPRPLLLHSLSLVVFLMWTPGLIAASWGFVSPVLAESPLGAAAAASLANLLVADARSVLHHLPISLGLLSFFISLDCSLAVSVSLPVSLSLSLSPSVCLSLCLFVSVSVSL